MSFQLYDFVGLRSGQKLKTVVKELDKVDGRVFFIREIVGADEYACDVYRGENLTEKHFIKVLDLENYEKKKIRATFKIREFYPNTGTFVDNPTVFNGIDAIQTDAPRYAIWSVSIVCDSDCKALGIDPAAPWPPKAI